ncbi:Protein root UVB sensitive 3 [Glycine soja]
MVIINMKPSKRRCNLVRGQSPLVSLVLRFHKKQPANCEVIKVLVALQLLYLGMETSSSVSNKTITLEEWNGSSPTKLSKTFTIKASSSSVLITRSGARFTHVWRRLLQAFGFPSSVTADYVPFQIWDLLQGLSTYIRTMLSTQALLSAIGVGEKSATVIGATFQWFLRDLTGMLGGILFTFYQGSNLDSNAKMWRLVADLMNDLGMLMDLISPLFPSAFVFVVCLGSISRSFTGVASGATRAALTQHFALQDNAADISAKEGSQETVATMIGMALGMLVARLTIGHPLAIWFSFLSLTVFHMYANYRAVRCLALNSLNPERSSILLQHFMETGQAKYLLVERKGIIDVIVHKDSNAADVLKSFFHALVLAKNVHKSKSLHSEGQKWIDYQYEVFIQKLKSLGWKTERLLSPIIWRAYWSYEPLEEKND